MSDGAGRRVALITGASSGIGAATAKALHAQGWHVILWARRAEKLEELATYLEHRVSWDCVDAGQGSAVIKAAWRASQRDGTPDVLIHCAGAGQWKWVEDTPPDEAAMMMSAPYFAAFHVNHAFLPLFLERGAGTIIHVNSPVSQVVWPGAAGYAATRWALRGLTLAMQQDLAETAIRVSHVVFGEVSSEYFDANPGSRDRLPTISKLVPVMTPTQCADVLVRVVRRPRRQVVAPFMLRLFYWTHAVAPWLVRWLVRFTGERHPMST